MARLSIFFCLIAAILTGCNARPPAAGSTPYTIAIIPDTQYYTNFPAYQPLFVQMTTWIRDHKDDADKNIVLVLHEGDIVDYNNLTNPDDISEGHCDSHSSWAAAKRAMTVLDGHLPYIMCTGNHDYGVRNSEDRTSYFPLYFAPTDNPLNSDGQGGGILRGLGPNAFGAHTLENAYYELIAPDGRKLLILVVEWAPRDAAVDWANGILARPEFADHTAVLLTHTMINHVDEYDTSPRRSGVHEDAHDGQQIWDDLVGPSTNIEITFNGHVGGDQVGYRIDANASGKPVHQMLFNAQFLPMGGSGWLRLVTFEPDGKTVTIRTHSPVLDAVGAQAWRTGPEDQFSFEITPVR